MKLARPRPSRRSAALAAGVAGSLAMALSTSGTLSAFTAQIQNSVNTAASGTLTMKETTSSDAAGGTVTQTCTSNDGTPAGMATNSATCGTINKYGGATALTPGGAAATTYVQIVDTGTAPATAFTLTPGACTATALALNGGAAPSTVCGKFTVTVTATVGNGTTVHPIYSGTAAAFTSPVNMLAKTGLTSLAPNTPVKLTFSVALDSSADNSFAGYQISQPLTWNFTA
ncbi:hypothetical protein [Arsenicicoccus dermatophilus]|uniref:hypothetical protein n=1 Tax=Arsenicicoccus dermatophilus TaxID=1076331 RepID=UPI003916EDB4